MIYVTASLWLMIAVLAAWAVYHIWSGIAKPRLVNAVLLPGTLVAQLGHVLALLITGATVNKTALMEDNEDGAPVTEPNPRPKIPIIGPIIVGLLPLLAVGAALYLAVLRLGLPVMEKMPQNLISTELPGSVAAFWEQLRALISLAEGTLNAVRHADGVHWKIAIFVYLMLCLTVRMAPLPGNVRGHVGAIVTIGIVGCLAGTAVDNLADIIRQAWPILSLTVGWLLLLLMFTLVVRGALSSARMILRLER
jgi:hypothetical protein